MRRSALRSATSFSRDEESSLPPLAKLGVFGEVVIGDSLIVRQEAADFQIGIRESAAKQPDAHSCLASGAGYEEIASRRVAVLASMIFNPTAQLCIS
jgi:hypothetical protein